MDKPRTKLDRVLQNRGSSRPSLQAHRQEDQESRLLYLLKTGEEVPCPAQTRTLGGLRESTRVRGDLASRTISFAAVADLALEMIVEDLHRSTKVKAHRPYQILDRSDPWSRASVHDLVGRA